MAKRLTKKYLIYPLFLSMQGCPGTCIYCDQQKLSGAELFNLDQAVNEVRAFVLRNPSQEKQVAFYGGSFTALDQDFRDELLAQIGAVCDRSTTFRISTHPLWVSPEILDWCKAVRIQTVELGIQDFDDEVLNQAGRGYTGAEAIAAAQRVKDSGLELGIQLMPGLPGWSEASLQANYQALELLKPMFLRLYPLIVIKGTPLEEIYKRGDYLPLTLEQAVQQCADYYPLAESNNIRIIKLGIPSNLDPEEIVAGPWHPAFGELVQAELLVRNILESNESGKKAKLTSKEQSLLKAHGNYGWGRLQEILGAELAENLQREKP